MKSAAAAAAEQPVYPGSGDLVDRFEHGHLPVRARVEDPAGGRRGQTKEMIITAVV